MSKCALFVSLCACLNLYSLLVWVQVAWVTTRSPLVMCSSLSSLVIEYVGPIDEEPPVNPEGLPALDKIDWAVATPAEIGRLVDNLEQKLATEPWAPRL